MTHVTHVTQSHKPSASPRDQRPDSEPSENTVNDSLGTVDLADSTGLDCDQEKAKRDPKPKPAEQERKS